MFSNQVLKPKKYTKLKKKLVKIIRIWQRILRDLVLFEKKSRLRSSDEFKYVVFEHKSLLLRPLKDVDMYLQYNKITNLKIAISSFSGIIIKPSEIFSFWSRVKKPTKRRGYVDGLILTNGKTGKDVGGGLCQLGNLIYWIVLHSPLQVTERWRHSYDVFPDVNRKLPFGSGATLSYNYVDLRFKNNTKHNFQLVVWVSDKYLHGKLLSDSCLEEKYQIYETDHKIVRQLWGGYTRHNKLWKRIIFANGVEKDELIAENHAVMMYEPMLDVHKES